MASVSSAGESKVLTSGAGPIEHRHRRSALLRVAVDVGQLRRQEPVGLSPDLMRRAVVDPQRMGSPAYVDAERPPGERRLEYPLSEIPGEEQAVRPAPAQGRQEPQLRDADVLGLVDHAEVERRMRSLCHLRRQLREHAGLGQTVPVRRAQTGPARRSTTAAPAASRPTGSCGRAAARRGSPPSSRVARRRPPCSIPSQRKCAPKRWPSTSAAACRSSSRMSSFRRQVEVAHGGRVEAPPDAAHRMHFQALSDLRLVPDETLEARSQRGGQRIREGGQQDTALRMCTRQSARP